MYIFTSDHLRIFKLQLFIIHDSCLVLFVLENLLQSCMKQPSWKKRKG